MIFKTITDETTLSGQRIVGVLQARKIAQQQATAQLEIDIACLKKYQVACQNGTVTTEQFDTIMHKASASAVEYSAKIKAGTGTAQSYANAQRSTNSALQEVSISAGIASKVVKIFSTTLNMIAFTAIIKGFSWLIGKVDEWIVTAKEAKESADAFKKCLSTFFNETQSNLKTISSLSDRFDELSKNVDNTGKKIGGTEEEYAEFLDICQQVGQIMPGLITGYTNEGEAIITLQGKVDSLTDSYKEAIRTKAALFLSNGDEEGNSIESFFEDYNNFVNGYRGLFSPVWNDSIEDWEEYYGYDKIHEWLLYVKDATLDELNNLQGELRIGTVGRVYISKILDEFDLTNFTEENYNAIHDVLNNRLTIIEGELSDRIINIRSAFQNMLYADSDYWNIDDENAISAINSLYGSIDAEFIKENQLFSQKALQTFESNLVELFNNDITKQAIIDFYAPISDDETINAYSSRKRDAFDTIQSYCNNNNIPINLKATLGLDNYDELYNNYSSLLNDTAKRISGASDGEIINQRGNYEKYQEIYDAIDKFATENSINTQDEIAYLHDALEEANDDIDKAFELYLSKIQDSLDGDNKTASTISDSVSQIATQLEPQFTKLGDAYKSIFTADGMNLEVVDTSMLEGLRKSFAEIEEEIGVTFDASLLNGFFDTLSDGTSTAEEVHDAFNDLASAYFYSTDTLSHLNAETAESIKQQLQQMGVVNSEEVVDHYLQLTEAESELLELQNQLADARKELVESSNTGEYENANARINSIYRQIEAYYAEKGATEELRLALFNLQLQQANLSINSIDSSASAAELLRLAEAAGLSAEYIEKLNELMDLLNQYNSLQSSNDLTAGIQIGDVYRQIQDIKNQLEDGLEAPELEVDFPSGKDSGAGSAGKDAADEYMDAFNAEFDRLKFLRDNGIINEKEYLDQLRVNTNALYRSNTI